MTRNELLERITRFRNDLYAMAASAESDRLYELLGETERLQNDICHVPSTHNRRLGVRCYTVRQGLQEFTRLRCAVFHRTTVDHKY